MMCLCQIKKQIPTIDGKYPSVNHHLVIVEVVVRSFDPSNKGHVVEGSLPLVGSPKLNILHK